MGLHHTGSRFQGVLLGALLAVSSGGVLRADPLLDFYLEGGQVTYEERLAKAPTTSDWSAPYLLGGGKAALPLAGDLLVLVNGAVWGSTEEEETWTTLGRTSQQNALWAGGGEAAAELGYLFGREGKTRLLPSTGIGFIFQRFERSGFRLFGSEESFVDETVDEDFEIAFATGGLELQQELSDQLELYAQGRYGYVFYYTADNSAFGSVDGDGGTLLEGRLGLRWKLSDEMALALGIRYYNQDLDGATEDGVLVTEDGDLIPAIIELPDNELTRVGGEVRWQVAF